MAIPDKRCIALAVVAAAAGALLTANLVRGPEPAAVSQPGNMAVLRALAGWDRGKVVDLTLPFYPGMPHREALGDQTIEPLFAHEPGVGRLGAGAQLDRYSLVGQWGTHVDAPVHFGAGMRSVDQLRPDEMILPLVVLDIHAAVASNPDYVVSMEDVRGWERQHGQVPLRAFIALRSDWSKRWPDATAFFNTDARGISHYPGWSEAVLRYLDLERMAVAIGHETPDTDPGIVASASTYMLESWHLRQDRFQIEMLCNLDRVPAAGAVVLATWPNVKGGSGFPARVIALLP
jgi:kynurenine formamidase